MPDYSAFGQQQERQGNLGGSKTPVNSSPYAPQKPAQQPNYRPLPNQPQQPQGYQQPQQKQQIQTPAYTPTNQPYGMDQTMPGVNEQYWNNNQNMWNQSPQGDWANQQLPQFEQPGFGEQFTQENIGAFGQPGQGQQFWNQVMGSYNQNGQQYNGPNNAQEAYGRTSDAIPGSLNPSFDAYYDRARDNAVGAADSAAASRGVYGSSSALNNVGNVITDIESQRANRASDFALQDSQNQRGWMDSAGNQARSADLTGLNTFSSGLEGLGAYGDLAFNAENADLSRDSGAMGYAQGAGNQEMNRLTSGIEAALGLDAGSLSRLNSGFNASNTAQDQRDNRIGGQYDDQMQMLQMLLPYLTQQYGGIIEGDQDLMGQGIEAGLGGTQNAVNDSRYNQERIYRDVDTGVKTATGVAQYRGSR